jgi:hypothetical protein
MPSDDQNEIFQEDYEGVFDIINEFEDAYNYNEYNCIYDDFKILEINLDFLSKFCLFLDKLNSAISSNEIVFTKIEYISNLLDIEYINKFSPEQDIFFDSSINLNDITPALSYSNSK